MSERDKYESQKRYWAKMRATGRCVRCGKLRGQYKSRCDDCAEKERGPQRERARVRRRRNGTKERVKPTPEESRRQNTERARQYRERHPGRIAEQRKTWANKPPTPENKRLYQRRYRERHPGRSYERWVSSHAPWRPLKREVVKTRRAIKSAERELKQGEQT